MAEPEVIEPTGWLVGYARVSTEDQHLTAGFTYHECPDCGFDAVTTANGQSYTCAICAEDNGRDVTMRSRPACDDDAPEGRDWRKEMAHAGR